MHHPYALAGLIGTAIFVSSVIKPYSSPTSMLKRYAAVSCECPHRHARVFVDSITDGSVARMFAYLRIIVLMAWVLPIPYK